MKVLMLGWELPPHNSGGLGVACYQLCRALSKIGADIEFILPYEAEHGEIDFMKVNSALPLKPIDLAKVIGAYDSFKYVTVDGQKHYLPVSDVSVRYETAVAKVVETASFDIIHAHDWLTCRAALLAKEKSGKPLILHFHSIESNRAAKEGAGNPVVREIEAVSMMLADRVITVSEHTKQEAMREYGIPGDKIEVVHNGMEFDDFEKIGLDNAYLYLEKMREHGWRVVVNVGRHTIQKGVTNLLRAMQKVVELEPKTLLLMVGSGDQHYELIELAAELGISQNVLFTGFQRGKNYRDAYAAGDLFVMPSVSEPFGLTPIEAAAYGTPSLISKQSGVAEIFKNTLTVDFWDIDEMVNLIVSSLRNQALLDELKSGAQAEIANLTWSKPAERLMGLYHHHLGVGI